MEIIEEYIQPGRDERKLPAPDWVLNGPTAPAIEDIAPDGQLYRHQSIALELLAQDRNLVISTGTASGKSLIFQIPTFDRLMKDEDAVAIAIYPQKSLARDQLHRWRRMAEELGQDPESINRIDGDMDLKADRTEILQRSKLVLITPDVIQAWLLNYSDDNLRTRSPGVNQTKQACREFIGRIKVIIIDEAHVYEGAFGAHNAYLLRRLRAKHLEQDQKKTEPMIIAASATILNPTEHLEALTGLQFEEIGEENNGSPRATLTIRHALGRTRGQGGEEDMTSVLREIIQEHPDDNYIAFVDSRQGVERIAAAIEPTLRINEGEIIEESRIALPYRAGLQMRELIEEALRSGNVRGLTATSAFELGIDMPILIIGITLGLPESIKKTRQRAGRIGRSLPGIFIIVEDRYAFQFDEGGLRGYWERPIEPARLYLDNPFIQKIHAKCLKKELDDSTEIPDLNWPQGFQAIAQCGEEGEVYNPDLRADIRQDLPAEKEYPHQHEIRSIADKSFQIIVSDKDEPLANSVSKTEAMKDLYTLATYWHVKQAYMVKEWHEDGTPENQHPHVVLKLSPDRVRTAPIRETGARLDMRGAESIQTAQGILAYLDGWHATGLEIITGCSKLENTRDGGREWVEYIYDEQEEDIPDIERQIPTTATLVQISQDWFKDPTIRESIGQALLDITSHLGSINSADLSMAFKGITILENDEERPLDDAIVLWDRTYGGLGLARELHDNIADYAHRLLQVAEDPGREADPRNLPITMLSARRFEQWAQALLAAQQRTGEQKPAEETPNPTPVPQYPTEPERNRTPAPSLRSPVRPTQSSRTAQPEDTDQPEEKDTFVEEPIETNGPAAERSPDTPGNREHQDGIRPIRTTYKGVKFRSQLEARWAAWFDQNQIQWEYEPTRFRNWMPDFRIVLSGQTVYTEVKPSTDLPIAAREKIDRSGWNGRAMVLGKTDEHIWTRDKTSAEWRRTNSKLLIPDTQEKEDTTGVPERAGTLRSILKIFKK